MTMLAADRLSLAPLGAGDLIDRTVRLYRRHFLTLVRAGAPPVILLALGSVLGTVGARAFVLTESGAWLLFYGLMILAGWALRMVGLLLFMIVMGGAARNLVEHLLENKPVSARAIYKSVRARFWGLLGASLIISLCAGMVGTVVTLVWAIALFLGFAAIGLIAQALNEAFTVLLAIGLFLASVLGALFLFFFIIGRLAYVPQVMLIEGRGVFAALGRSIQLARGNVRRLTAMFLFATFATYSALMLLLVPLTWYGYLNGIEPWFWRADEWPMWYAIGNQVAYQSSLILLAPVWMMGLSLLYVDERVRHEGYDIELMAAQRLGAIPTLPDGRAAPLTPALVGGPPPEQALL